jgi:hypothetical protein
LVFPNRRKCAFVESASLILVCIFDGTSSVENNVPRRHPCQKPSVWKMHFLVLLSGLRTQHLLAWAYIDMEQCKMGESVNC